jgi:hypothetical protein
VRLGGNAAAIANVRYLKIGLDLGVLGASDVPQARFLVTARLQGRSSTSQKCTGAE